MNCQLRGPYSFTTGANKPYNLLNPSTAASLYTPNLINHTGFREMSAEPQSFHGLRINKVTVAYGNLYSEKNQDDGYEEIEGSVIAVRMV